MKKVEEILAEDMQIEVLKPLSSRQEKRLREIELVVAKRKAQAQDVGYNARHLVLCSLPFKPTKDLTYERRNGIYTLQITGHPKYGVPFGQDRLWLIWLATEVVRQQSRTIVFKHAGDILRAFGLSTAGYNYNRLKEGLQRIFGSAIFFGSDVDLGGNLLLDSQRGHYLDRMTLWFRPDEAQELLPDESFMNVIEVSEYFYNELILHPIPVDLEVVRSLSDSPGALDFYTWVVWRCWCIEEGGSVRIPLTGPQGLDRQMGMTPYAQVRRWRFKVGEWLAKAKSRWEECPAEISADGAYLVLRSGKGILGRPNPTPQLGGGRNRR